MEILKAERNARRWSVMKLVTKIGEEIMMNKDVNKVEEWLYLLMIKAEKLDESNKEIRRFMKNEDVEAEMEEVWRYRNMMDLWQLRLRRKVMELNDVKEDMDVNRDGGVPGNNEETKKEETKQVHGKTEKSKEEREQSTPGFCTENEEEVNDNSNMKTTDHEEKYGVTDDVKEVPDDDCEDDDINDGSKDSKKGDEDVNNGTTFVESDDENEVKDDYTKNDEKEGDIKNDEKSNDTENDQEDDDTEKDKEDDDTRNNEEDTKDDVEDVDVKNESDGDGKSEEKDEVSDKEEEESDDPKSKDVKEEEQAVKASDKKDVKRVRKSTKALKSADQDEDESKVEDEKRKEKGRGVQEKAPVNIVRCDAVKRKPMKYDDDDDSEVGMDQPSKKEDYKPNVKTAPKKDVLDYHIEELWCFKGGTVYDALDVTTTTGRRS